MEVDLEVPEGSLSFWADRLRKFGTTIGPPETRFGHHVLALTDPHGLNVALVEAPDGIGYILKPGDALGDGRVTGLTPNSVTFAVSARGSRGATSLTLRLPEQQ